MANNACISCDKRWLEGSFNYINITMCQKCIDNYKSRHKTRDYSGFEEATDIVYSRVSDRAVPKRVKTIHDYLRTKKV
jgi:hypothetical protein